MRSTKQCLQGTFVLQAPDLRVSRALCHRQPAARFGGDAAVSTSSWHRKKKYIICSSLTPPSSSPSTPHPIFFLNVWFVSLVFKVHHSRRRTAVRVTCRNFVARLSHPEKSFSFLSSLVLFHAEAEINNTASSRDLVRWAKHVAKIFHCLQFCFF